MMFLLANLPLRFGRHLVLHQASSMSIQRLMPGGVYGNQGDHGYRVVMVQSWVIAGMSVEAILGLQGGMMGVLFLRWVFLSLLHLLFSWGFLLLLFSKIGLPLSKHGMFVTAGDICL